MKCPKCGNDQTFTAHQVSRHDIIIDSNGHFLEDKGIYDSETPYGPFSCTECDHEFDQDDFN